MTQRHPEASAKIDTYIAALPAPWDEVCTRLRAIVHRAAPDLEEDWKWGCPCFAGESLVCGFAAFKKHLTVDFFRGAFIDDPDGVFNHGLDNAKSRGVKLLEGDSIPEASLVALVRQAARLDAEGVEPQGKKRVKPPVAVPAEFEEAFGLKKNAKARAFFDSLPPSAQREYCEWIASAKREETRKRRLAKALDQLARGERMHEKYR